MKSLYTVFLFIFFILTVFTGINIIGQDLGDNSNLDADSKEYITTLNSQLNNKESEDYISYEDATVETNVDAQSNEENDFSLQFQMSRGAASQNQESLKTIQKAPALFYYAFGMDTTEWSWARNLIAWLLTGIVAMIVFVLIFGAGRIFPNGGY